MGVAEGSGVGVAEGSGVAVWPGVEVAAAFGVDAGTRVGVDVLAGSCVDAIGDGTSVGVAVAVASPPQAARTNIATKAMPNAKYL